jgi:hypothetical protein
MNRGEPAPDHATDALSWAYSISVAQDPWDDTLIKTGGVVRNDEKLTRMVWV